MRRVRTWMSKYDRSRTPLPGAHVRAHEASVDGYFTIVLNTNPYTYLGNRPLDLSPAATFDRGLVAITFQTLKVGAILPALGGALRGGGMKSSSHGRRADRPVVPFGDSHDRPFPFQLDGDYLGETLELRFEHRPNAVNLRSSVSRLRRARSAITSMASRARWCRSRRCPTRSARPFVAGSSHVHVLTMMPAPWQASTCERCNVATHGMERGVAHGRPWWRSRRRAPRRPTTPCGCRASSARQRSTVSMRNDEISQRSSSSRSRSVAIVSSAIESVGSKSGSCGSFLISTFTHMPAQASSAACEVRHECREIGRIDVDDRPAIGQMRVVVDHQHAVGGAAHVELDAVAAHRPRHAKRLDGVLRRGS